MTAWGAMHPLDANRLHRLSVTLAAMFYTVATALLLALGHWVSGWFVLPAVATGLIALCCWGRRGLYTVSPIPPERVRLVYPDGREVPLEVVYEGLSNGYHVWGAVLTVPLAGLVGGGAEMQVDNLPPRTAIRLGATR